LVVSGPHLNFLSRATPEGQGIPYAKHPPGIKAKKEGEGTCWEHNGNKKNSNIQAKWPKYFYKLFP